MSLPAPARKTDSATPIFGKSHLSLNAVRAPARNFRRHRFVFRPLLGRRDCLFNLNRRSIGDRWIWLEDHQVGLMKPVNDFGASPYPFPHGP